MAASPAYDEAPRLWVSPIWNSSYSAGDGRYYTLYLSTLCCLSVFILFLLYSLFFFSSLFSCYIFEIACKQHSRPLLLLYQIIQLFSLIFEFNHSAVRGRRGLFALIVSCRLSTERACPSASRFRHKHNQQPLRGEGTDSLFYLWTAQ